jgi:hypothetical protein
MEFDMLMSPRIPLALRKIPYSQLFVHQLNALTNAARCLSELGVPGSTLTLRVDFETEVTGD